MVNVMALRVWFSPILAYKSSLDLAPGCRVDLIIASMLTVVLAPSSLQPFVLFPFALYDSPGGTVSDRVLFSVDGELLCLLQEIDFRSSRTHCNAGG